MNKNQDVPEQQDLSYELCYAAFDGDLKELLSLMEKALLEDHHIADILINAAASGNLEMVKHLVELPVFNDKFVSCADDAFYWAHKKGYLPIMEFFIFELQIPKTLSIEKTLLEFRQQHGYPNDRVEEMFIKRDRLKFHDKLQEQLACKEQRSSQNKL